jgi:hypothetical protein
MSKSTKHACDYSLSYEIPVQSVLQELLRPLRIAFKKRGQQGSAAKMGALAVQNEENNIE